ncbi:twin-arginine translocase subunit TatC, partial [Pseudomonadales bacterium]|nr:twin-arginine translocase subunit TatC [Pseudomonadales bacterium]
MNAHVEHSTKQGATAWVSHLLELRNRLLYVLLAVGLVFLALVGFANEIYTFIANPLMVFLPENASMIATE